MNDTTERIEQIEFEHAQAIESLEDRLAKMEDAVETFLAEGRPHSRTAMGYPDGCECPLCERWDTLNRSWQAVIVPELKPLQDEREEWKKRSDLAVAFETAANTSSTRTELDLMQAERDAAILERDKIQGLFALLNDQNLRLAQRIGRIRAALDEPTELK